MRQAKRRPFFGAMTVALAGCVAVPLPPVAVSSAPAITGPSCPVTLVRKRQVAGSVPSHFIALDKLTEAVLEAGEYTAFPVSGGRHTLTVTWHVGDKVIGAGGFGAGAGAVVWSPYEKSVAVDCRAPREYFFTIAAKGFPLDEADRVEFERVERLDGDFMPERNRFVRPGPR
jgi:hypothetical protein